MTTVEAAADAAVLGGNTGAIMTIARPGIRLPLNASSLIAAPRIAPPLTAVARRRTWERQYSRRLRLIDTLVVLACTAGAAVLQLVLAGGTPSAHALFAAGWVAVVTAAIWLVLLVVFQTRSADVVGHGAHEYRRLAHTTGMAFGVLAMAFVLLQWEGLRTQVLIALPSGILVLLYTRWLSRRWLSRRRAAGEFISRALVVGRRGDVEYVIRSVHQDEESGYRVVGVALEDDESDEVAVDGTGYLAIGSADHAGIVAAQLGADAVIIASTPRDRPDYLKQLAWQLEGTASELVLSSPLTDVAGPRMSLRPVEGLPLVQVKLPSFDGGRFALKRAVDAVLAGAALVAVGLVAPVIALAIKLDSAGPVFFRQERVGRDGRTFKMLKFRSMGVDAEARLAELEAAHDGSGPLFKMKSDPRVTRVGAFLRRYSLDELPQFWNVFVGDMSIVGPRPPLPKEARTYGASTTRRLFIKPGITGPWQVGGRSDLSWEESLRLDLRYVENWSLTEDLLIMARTARAMVSPTGAY